MFSEEFLHMLKKLVSPFFPASWQITIWTIFPAGHYSQMDIETGHFSQFLDIFPSRTKNPVGILSMGAMSHREKCLNQVEPWGWGGWGVKGGGSQLWQLEGNTAANSLPWTQIHIEGLWLQPPSNTEQVLPGELPPPVAYTFILL